MSKYIDADKLIAEIERRKNQTERRVDNIVPIRRKDTMDEEQLAKIELRDKVDKAYFNGVLITLSDILSSVTSLQQEQPSIPSNIDEATKEYIRNYIPFGQCDSRDIVNTFKAGAEWMARQGQTIESLIWRDEDGNLYIEEYIDKNKFKKADNIVVQVRKKQ